jgi:DNA invertase Pin-like site-specific DNA recombinase
MTNVAVWLRVSTGQRDSGNQVHDIERFAAHHGYEIAELYEVSESAWN